ncbi:MAG: ABC transporter permease [Phycisphaerae bacterium]|nr:ABC transporter permease [Phycisphaerae bacterium]
MYRLALRMLTRDTGKYLALVVGLTFATLLITQQGSIFLGLIKRSTGVLQNVGQPDLWVCDPRVQTVLEIRNMSDRDFERVRTVPGVAWAEPFFSSRATVELTDGSYKTAQLIGVDRSTLVGQPPEVLVGSLDDLRAPDAIMVDESSRSKLAYPEIGDTLKLNDRRAVVVGICRAKLGFDSNAMIYTTFDNARRFTPLGREKIPFILVKTQEGADVPTVASSIRERTGLGAWTRDEMEWLSTRFILTQTGIGINFGTTVLLGFIVGLAVTAAIFYQFTIENLKHFAVLKAMGTRNGVLVRMVMLQAITVGAIGFGIGSGLAGLFSLQGRRPGAELAPYLPWQLLLMCMAGMLVCIVVGSILSIRKVVRLEPAVVFK